MNNTLIPLFSRARHSDRSARGTSARSGGNCCKMQGDTKPQAHPAAVSSTPLCSARNDDPMENGEWRVESGEWRAAGAPAIFNFQLSIFNSPVIPTGAARDEPRSGGICPRTQGGTKQQAHPAADSSTPLRSARNDDPMENGEWRVENGELLARQPLTINN
jgi:hypothetical protein